MHRELARLPPVPGWFHSDGHNFPEIVDSANKGAEAGRFKFLRKHGTMVDKSLPLRQWEEEKLCLQIITGKKCPTSPVPTAPHHWAGAGQMVAVSRL